MKNIKYYAAAFIFVTGVFVSCSQGDPYQYVDAIIRSNTVTGLTVSIPMAMLTVGESQNVQALLNFEDGSSRDVTGEIVWTVTGSATMTGNAVVPSAAGTVTLATTYTPKNAAPISAHSSFEATNDIFVAETGNDTTGTGSTLLPYRSIEKALTAAASPKAIRVAGGTYDTATQLEMIEGVSMYGGYAAGSWVRNMKNNISIMNDTSTSGGTMGPNTPKAALHASSSLTNTTVLEGFTIKGSLNVGMTISSAVYIEGSPKIVRCVLMGGYGTSYSRGAYFGGTAAAPVIDCTIDGGSGVTNSYGIYCVGAAQLVHQCRISGGTATTTSGVYATSASSFFNNIITGGSNAASTSSAGVTTSGASATVQIVNNTITGGMGTSTYGISAEAASKPYIINNVILLSAGGVRYAIVQNSTGGNGLPYQISNNLVYNQTAFMHVLTPSTANITIATLEASPATYSVNTAGGNIILDPQLDSAKGLRPTNTSPVILFIGGLNMIDEGYTQFPKDAGGNPIDADMKLRPGAGAGVWSIGAYQ